MASVEDALQSSQAFIRALKSAKDPPYEQGPSKIQIARLGWDSQSLYMPRKSDLILEWILTRIYKEKSRPSHENPLLDLAHWSLLADILAHPSNTHIVPLISRTSVPALVTSFIASYPSLPTSSRAPLLATVLRSLNVLWPLAVQRTGIDSLSECLWSCLSVIDQLGTDLQQGGLTDILTFVFTAFCSAFENANAAGKKKAYLALSQYQLHPWLRALRLLPSAHPLHIKLYSVGTDILLNADSLRTSLESNPNANANTDLFSTLFGSSTASDPESRLALLDLLPRLYKSYVAALRKHRSSIFSGATAGQQGRERLRHAAMRFGSACLVFLKATDAEMTLLESVWRARVGVLHVTEEEAMFDYAEGDDAAEKIREVGEDALKVLDRARDGAVASSSLLTTQALNALSCLHRIEPDIIVPFIPKILERLATCSAVASHASLTFLTQLTSYHSKTRTLHILISHLLTALSSSFPFLPFSDAKATYGFCTRSPLLSLPFADELSNALRAFATPGQADEAVKSVMEALEASCPTREAPEEPARKRRKVTSGDDEEMPLASQGDGKGPNTVKFVFVASLGVTALGATLQGGTRKDAAQRKSVCLESIDGLLSSAMEAAFEPGSGGSGKVTKKRKGKRPRQEDGNSRWVQQCLCAALLRLWYDLFARSGAPWTETEGEATWAVPKVLDRLHSGLICSMHDEEVLPELQMEIGRVLYARGASLGHEAGNQDTKGWPALDTMLDYVEANLFDGNAASTSATVAWEHLTDLTKRDTALALWSLTVERHLSTIDAHASQAQLDRLVSLMVRARLDVPSAAQEQEQRPSGASVLARALASASFWEFGNVRTSMLAALDRQTAGFGLVDTSKWLTAVIGGIGGDLKAVTTVSKANKMPWNDIKAGVEVYRLLHYFPPEYLSRASRAELAKRALAADILVCALSPKEEPTLQGPVEWRAVLRSFIVMVARQTQTKTIDEMASFQGWLPYLTLSKHAPGRPTAIFIDATLDLLSLTYTSAMRATVKSEGASLINVLTHFIQCSPFTGDNLPHERLAQQSLLRFIGTLIREFKVSSFNEQALRLLQQLCLDLDGTLKPAIRATAGQAPIVDFLASGHVIEAWQVLLSLKRWLSIEPDAETFGETLLASTARIIGSGPTEVVTIPDEFRVNVISLLAEQGQILPEAECRHVESIVAAYILFTTSTPQDESACDASIVRATKLFSVTQFESILEFVADALESGSDSQSHLVSLMRLSTLLLREAPERTSKLSHEHAARCLRIFVNRPSFTTGTSTLAAAVLDFIHCQCAERAASLKTFDTACIWTILSRLLMGCSEHDERTSASSFQTMVSIVNALVRLRRDLLGPNLPQLSMVLRHLIRAVRGVRPLLGVKQHRIVGDTLPKWINPDCPLGEAEARSLARLLTALTTKSLVRSHASNDSQKAESLARPFARHAPYVLLAYIQLMNDPLSVLSVAVRRELEPGLFALCGIMGEHGRDTLMVQSLDVGGKALLKSLWKEYDKQRYIGRG